MKSYDMVVKGNMVTSSAVHNNVQLAIAHGKIAAIVDGNISLNSDSYLDATNQFIFPGIVDAHVHCNSSVDEGVANTTRSALAGGSTTIIDMPFDCSGIVASASVARAKKDVVNAESFVDVALLATIKKTGEIEDLEALLDVGVCGFKMSVLETDPNRFPRIDDGVLYDVLPKLAACSLPVGFHAENAEIIHATTKAARAQGQCQAHIHCTSRPPLTEYIEVAKLLEFALFSNVALHLNHLTLSHSLEMALAYRAKGLNVSLETCPHYLLLDERDVHQQGMALKVNPPLRSSFETEALWKHVLAGRVDIWASDHSPWPMSKKSSDDVFDNASGMPGAETFFPLMFSEAVMKRGAHPSLLARHMAEIPARRYALDHRKGGLRPGADADLTIIDPAVTWVVHAEDMFSVAGWTPYEGRTVQGKVSATICRGRLAYDGRDILALPGDGCFIPAAGPHRECGLPADEADRC